MAGTTEASQGVEAEIQQLKALPDTSIRVIRDVGDYTHVISVKLKKQDSVIKFQINGDYPQTAPECIVRSECETVLQLAEQLRDKANQLIREPMLLRLVQAAADHVTSNCQTSHLPRVSKPKEQRQTDKHKKAERRAERRKKKQAQEDVIDEKLPSMKTAEDVISRLMWDGSLSVECFTVGYIDRFLGVVEKNFTAFSWEDIASVDWSTLAIPKHRIQYFKYKNVKVWDKNKRLDNIFGSTGSGVTIQQVIENYKDEQFEDADEDNQYYSQSDEDDIDVNIDVGMQEEAENPNHHVDPYWGPKVRPTHFLCLRITNPKIQETVSQAEETILDICDTYDDCVIPPKRLHVTLCCLGLDDDDQVKFAVDTLAKCKSELAGLNPANIAVELEGVDNFFHNVLYAKVKQNQQFLDFVDHLKMCLTEAGVEIRDVFEFTPHMTLVKLSKSWARQQFTRYLDSRLYTVLEDTYFGKQSLDNIHLCEMSEDRDSSGFYVTPTSIQF